MKKLLVLCVFISVAICGCISPNEVQLSPRYQYLLEMSAVNLGGICEDCQNDIEAILMELESENPDLVLIKQIATRKSCEQGLKKASELLNHIVNASYGRAD